VLLAVECFQLFYLLPVDRRGKITTFGGIRDVLKFFWRVFLVKFYPAVYDVLSDFRRRISPLG
jgi:hypothetical protein